MYLEHAITIYNADALSIHDNFIAECGNCIELRGWGQASKITDNLIGAGFKGYSVFVQNFGGILISSNNIFPRGASSIYFDNVSRSLISNNRLHSFYPGMLVFSGDCYENLVSSNHFLRDQEPWLPFQGYSNGLDDTYGLICLNGSNNSIIGNHFSLRIDSNNIRPSDAKPVIIRIASGSENYVSNNNVVTKDTKISTSDSCYSSQIESLLDNKNLINLDVITVLVEEKSVHNTILDSGNKMQVVLNKNKNIFRPTPVL